MPPSNEPIRIAVFRALQLGDMLCAIPALHVLRGAFPHARITLVGLPWSASLVARYQGLLDEHVEFPGYPGITERGLDPRALATFVARAADDPPDLALQLHGSGIASNGFVALLEARQAIGAYRPGAWCPGPGFIPYPEHLSEVDRLQEVLHANGIAGEGRLDFPLLSQDRAELEAELPELEPRTYVCLHPGARDPRRRWPPERFAAVADHLSERGYRVLLTGTAGDAEAHRAVQAASSHPVVSLAGRLGLGAFAALLTGARLVVTNDTGTSHLAAALGVPSVVVFSGSDPARWAPADRERHRVLGGPMRDGPVGHCCLGEACARRHLRWRDVPAAEVLAAVGDQLEGGVEHAA